MSSEMIPYMMVQEFNREVLGVEVDSYADMTPNEEDLLIVQMKEEISEFITACSDDDVVDKVDALIDSIYFAMGGLYRIGVTNEAFEKIFAVIHTANMTKKKGRVATRPGHSAPDAVKPEGWVPPEVQISVILSQMYSHE